MLQAANSALQAMLVNDRRAADFAAQELAEVRRSLERQDDAQAARFLAVLQVRSQAHHT